MMVNGGQFPLVLIRTHEIFIIFFLPYPVEEGSNGEALVGTWHPDMVSPPQKHGKTDSLVVIYGLQLDSMILFFNLRDSVILWSKTDREQVEARH